MQYHIFSKQIATPLGDMVACAVNGGICLLEFADRKELKAELTQIATHFNSKIIPGSPEPLLLLENELQQYFAGSRQSFTVPLFPVGTDFQKRVWQQLLTIPYGKTTSYKAQAITLGNLSAIRAVANANGKNKIAILTPCHRVTGHDGALTGYAGGLWRKNFLLQLEQKNARQATINF